MSRSVATHSRAVQTFYLHMEDDESEWDWFIEDLRNVIKERYPSFDDYDGYNGRETREILSNGHAVVGVSEYCGLVAVCLATRERETYYSDEARMKNLDESWCYRVKFREYLATRYSNGLTRLGSASNGEAFFAPINRPNGMVTSKEGVLW